MLEELQNKWPEILEYFKKEYDIHDISFKTWIQPLHIHSFKNNQVILHYTGVGGSKGIDHLSDKYKSTMELAIQMFLDNPEIELIISLPENDNTNESLNTSSLEDKINNLSIDSRIKDSNLKEEYTFDSFVVGSNNSIAQVTALAVAESPGQIYNPLFIYGGVGLGKTHLIQSIGNFVLKTNQDAKVLYTTSESFINEVIDLLAQNKKQAKQEDFIEFRKKYRNVDVLLIDDIQFISNKERCQEEFFNIFNELHMKNKQIVITADKKPKDMEGIEERLINRFSQGLTVDIQNPDYETRMAILKTKSSSIGYNIDDNVLQFIANNFVSSIRELEGALNRVIAFSKIGRDEITVDFASNVLNELISPNKEEKITCQYIIDIVADHFQISSADICSVKRSREFAYPRQICMYLCRVYTDETLDNIGSFLKKNNHATVKHGYEKIKKEIESDPSTKDLIDILKKKINPM